MWQVQERKHTLDGVAHGRLILVEVAYFVRRAVRRVVRRRQWAIGHVSLCPLRPYASRLDGNDFDVPFRGELLLEGLAESLESCQTHLAQILSAMKPRRHAELACRVIGEGGVPIETTYRRNVEDSASRGFVFSEVLDSLGKCVRNADLHDRPGGQVRTSRLMRAAPQKLTSNW